MPVAPCRRMASQAYQRAVRREIASPWCHHWAHQRNSPPRVRRYMGTKWVVTQLVRLGYRGLSLSPPGLAAAFSAGIEPPDFGVGHGEVTVCLGGFVGGEARS